MENKCAKCKKAKEIINYLLKQGSFDCDLESVHDFVGTYE